MRTAFVTLALAVLYAARAAVTFDLTILETGVGYAGGIFAVGDIDGDGKNDIVGGGSGRLYWIKHSDIGTKNTIASSAALGYEIHVADVDNDGDLDVLSPGAGLTWWENPLNPGGNPAGGSWSVHRFGSFGASQNGGSHDFKAGDINGDGKIDAVEREQNSGTWHLFVQNSPTSWAEKTINASRSGEGTWLGDIDGDGDLDLTDGWAWFECPSDPVGGTWIQHNVGNATHHLTRVVIADINGDGRMDIVSGPCEFGGSKLVWFEAPADSKGSGWTEHVLTNYNDPNYHTLQVGDIDLDGHLDIIVGSTHGPCAIPKIVRVFYNTNGNGLNMTEDTWNTQDGVWQGVLGDVGSDGDLDFLSCDYSGARSEFWENKLDPVTVVAAGRQTMRGRRASRSLRVVVDVRRISGPAYDVRGRGVRVVLSQAQQVGVYVASPEKESIP